MSRRAAAGHCNCKQSAKHAQSGLRFRAALAALAGSLLLAACAGFGVPSKPPEVSFAGIEWRQGNLAEQHFSLALRVDNPNAQALPVSSLTLEVEFAGKRFASGRSAAPVTIPADGEATLVIDVVSDLASVLRLVREARREGRTLIDYRLVGEVEVEGYGRHPFTRSGVVPTDRVERRLLRPAPAGAGKSAQ